MTPAQFRWALSRLDLTRVETARYFGVSDRQVRNWASGHTKVPRAIQLLLEFRLRDRCRAQDLSTGCTLPRAARTRRI
jgi:hypothetical protein